jgi:hypothetical protein
VDYQSKHLPIQFKSVPQSSGRSDCCVRYKKKSVVISTDNNGDVKGKENKRGGKYRQNLSLGNW